MLPIERRITIVAQMHEQPMVRADALASRFDVSVETVRRDLRRLNADGLLHRDGMRVDLIETRAGHLPQPSRPFAERR